MARMRFAVLLLAAASVLADEAPIGVFDSGLGGLTVLERLLDVDQVNNATGLYGPDGVPDLAREHFVYLGDQANMPYGDYSAEGKSDYLRELILKDAKFLLGTSYYQNAEEDVPSGTKKRVKIIVIACNTATAWGLDDIRRYLASIGDGTKVVGVIEAGVRATLDQLAARPDSPPFAIGVMATPGTISSGAYARTIRAELKARGVTISPILPTMMFFPLAPPAIRPSPSSASPLSRPEIGLDIAAGVGNNGTQFPFQGANECLTDS